MLKIRRIMRYDARHGQPYEDYETYDAGKIARAIGRADAAARREQAEVRSRKCLKCGNIGNADGSCDFCG